MRIEKPREDAASVFAALSGLLCCYKGKDLINTDNGAYARIQRSYWSCVC